MKKTVLAVKNVAKQAKAAAKQAVTDIKKVAKNAGKIARLVTSDGLLECVSAAVDFIPVVGNIKSAVEAITGFDPITGRKLEPWERAVAGVGILGGPAAKAIKHGGKLVQQGGKLLEKGGNLLEKFANVLDTSRTQLAGAGVGAGTGFNRFSVSTGISTGKKTDTSGSKQVGNLTSSSSGKTKGNVASKGTGNFSKYDVGLYKEIKGAPGLDAHHVGQKVVMEKFVKNYDSDYAPAILVPKVGHTRRGPRGIVSRSTKGIENARQLLARDIWELRRVYPDIPNSQLLKLIDLNKKMYPEMKRR